MCQWNCGAVISCSAVLLCLLTSCNETDLPDTEVAAVREASQARSGPPSARSNRRGRKRDMKDPAFIAMRIEALKLRGRWEIKFDWDRVPEQYRPLIEQQEEGYRRCTLQRAIEGAKQGKHSSFSFSKFELTVAPDGTVASIPETSDPARQCYNSVLQGVTFPPTGTGKPMDLEFGLKTRKLLAKPQH